MFTRTLVAAAVAAMAVAGQAAAVREEPQGGGAVQPEGPQVTPTYLLPVDPNMPVASTFFSPHSNINPMNSAAAQASFLKGAGGPSTVPGQTVVGVQSGTNAAAAFPQFIEVRECSNCRYL